MLKYNPETERYERVKGETKDPSGNTVPETREDVAGGQGTATYYDFTNDQDSLIGWLQRLQALGIPVTGPIGDSGDITFKCSSKFEDGRWKIRCVRI